jgi:ribosome modulation factor
MKTITEEFIRVVSQEGFADYVSGKPAVANPYEGTRLRLVWYSGWRRAQEGGLVEKREARK